MLASLNETPALYAGWRCPDVLPGWMTLGEAPKGRREQLAPGVWVIHTAAWVGPSALDLGHDYLPQVETWFIEPRRTRVERSAWHDEALCGDITLEESQTLFFTEEASPTNLGIARGFCTWCPVVETCLRSALTQPEEHGVWAGTTRRQRLVWLRKIERGTLTVDQVVEEWLTTK